MTDQNTMSEKDWGNLRFTPRRSRYAEGTPDDNANSRFVIGLVVFVAVALLYPWYSYWVQTHLLARDFQRAAGELGAQLRDETQAVTDRTHRDQLQRQAVVDRRRVTSVQVMGAMATQGDPVVIVRMGDAGLSESRATICRQASHWLNRSTSGMRLHVQSQQGRLPAATIGSIDC
jgi:hypothetical protein